MTDTAWVDIMFGGVCTLLGILVGYGISEAVRRNNEQ